MYLTASVRDTRNFY